MGRMVGEAEAAIGGSKADIPRDGRDRQQMTHFGHSLEAAACYHPAMITAADALTVEMSPPMSGGMTLRFTSGTQQFGEDFTTSVFPFLERLCDAVRVLHDGFVDERI